MPTPREPRPSLGIVLAKVRSQKPETGVLRTELGALSTGLGALSIEVRGQSVLPEEMRSQNQANIEAVEMSRALEIRLDRLDAETGARDAGLELAVREQGR